MSGLDDREPETDNSQIYSLKNIVSSFSATDSKDILKSSSSITSSPCFKTSFLWSSAVSGAFVLHRIYQRGITFFALLIPNCRVNALVLFAGSPRQIVNGAFLGFFLTFSMQWYICRRNEFDRKIALKAYYQQQHDLQTGKKSASSVVESVTLPQKDAAHEMKDWQLQLEQLVRQDTTSTNSIGPSGSDETLR